MHAGGCAEQACLRFKNDPGGLAADSVQFERNFTPGRSRWKDAHMPGYTHQVVSGYLKRCVLERLVLLFAVASYHYIKDVSEVVYEVSRGVRNAADWGLAAVGHIDFPCIWGDVHDKNSNETFKEFKQRIERAVKRKNGANLSIGLWISRSQIHPTDRQLKLVVCRKGARLREISFGRDSDCIKANKDKSAWNIFGKSERLLPFRTSTGCSLCASR